MIYGVLMQMLLPPLSQPKRPKQSLENIVSIYAWWISMNGIKVDEFCLFEDDSAMGDFFFFAKRRTRRCCESNRLLLLKVDKRKTFQFCSLRILVVLMESLHSAAAPTVHWQTWKMTQNEAKLFFSIRWFYTAWCRSWLLYFFNQS